jgi:hypothetical protein
VAASFPTFACAHLRRRMHLGFPVARRRGTLKATMSNDLKYVDPFWTTAYVTRSHGYMIYDTLFALDANMQPHYRRPRQTPPLRAGI